MSTIRDITAKDFDSESYPQRCIRSPVLTEMRANKVPTVKRTVKTIVGSYERAMYKVSYKDKPAYLDAVTAQLYQNGKCLSSDQLEML